MNNIDNDVLKKIVPLIFKIINNFLFIFSLFYIKEFMGDEKCVIYEKCVKSYNELINCDKETDYKICLGGCIENFGHILKIIFH